MGRKGIGKLAVFSIASKVEVHTVKGRALSAFSMDLADLRADAKAQRPYYPKDLACVKNLTRGTRIVLRGINASLTLTDRFLRRHLSRRFTIIDGAHGFSITVNGKPLTLADREYYPKLQYIWHYRCPSCRLSLQRRNRKRHATSKSRSPIRAATRLSMRPIVPLPS